MISETVERDHCPVRVTRQDNGPVARTASVMAMLLVLAAMLDRAECSDTPMIQMTKSGFEVLDGDSKKRLLNYQLETKSKDGEYGRANYIHPLHDLDGNVLTEDFPADHKHHRGIYWAWHQVLIGDMRIGDPWICKNFEWDVVGIESHANVDQPLSVEIKCHWKSPDWMVAGEMQPFALETVKLQFHPSAKNHRMIDFDIQIVALVPNLQIGGSENAKGYGGFSLRIKNPLELRFRGKTGTIEPKTNAVSAGKWLEISNKDDKHNRIIVLTHKSLPEFPAPWILRNRSKSMQNVVYPGQHAKSVSNDPSKPLRLRYRLLIHRGEADAKTIEAWQSEYESTP